MEYKQIDSGLTVSGQLTVNDLPALAEKGVKTLICNRPDGEGGDQVDVVDAGLGAPSHAAEAMELGADAVLVNTAIAVNDNPCRMARAFAKAVEAGRMAYEIGLGGTSQEAKATSPLTAFLDE